jgi:hypothetical protein
LTAKSEGNAAEMPYEKKIVSKDENESDEKAAK